MLDFNSYFIPIRKLIPTSHFLLYSSNKLISTHQFSLIPVMKLIPTSQFPLIPVVKLIPTSGFPPHSINEANSYIFIPTLVMKLISRFLFPLNFNNEDNSCPGAKIEIGIKCMDKIGFGEVISLSVNQLLSEGNFFVCCAINAFFLPDFGRAKNDSQNSIFFQIIHFVYLYLF